MLIEELDQAEQDRFERDREERVEYDYNAVMALYSDDEEADAYRNAPDWYFQ